MAHLNHELADKMLRQTAANRMTGKDSVEKPEVIRHDSILLEAISDLCTQIVQEDARGARLLDHHANGELELQRKRAGNCHDRKAAVVAAHQTGRIPWMLGCKIEIARWAARKNHHGHTIQSICNRLRADWSALAAADLDACATLRRQSQ